MTPATEPTEQDITTAVAQWHLDRRFGRDATLPAYAADTVREQVVLHYPPEDCPAAFQAINEAIGRAV